MEDKDLGDQEVCLLKFDVVIVKSPKCVFICENNVLITQVQIILIAFFHLMLFWPAKLRKYPLIRENTILLKGIEFSSVMLCHKFLHQEHLIPLREERIYREIYF